MKHKLHSQIFAVLLSLVLSVALLPATVFAASPEGVWTDYAASGFAGGTGTEADPYQIATAEQLAKLSNDVSGGTSYQGTFFVLTENIDLSAHRWTPIGIYKWEETGTTINNSFQGFLDGNDKTISGMFVDERIDHYCGGLFGKINIQKNGSPVGAKDLTITGATVYVDETGLSECSGAILAGNVMGSDTQSVVFENITVSGSVYVTRTNGYNNIGGMLGYASWVKATNCHADGVSISGASNCGGFVGNDSGSIYENCTASGTIDGAWVVGGFVGYSASATWQDSAGASTYTKCSADVDVSGNDWRVGGFVGFAEYGQFNNCVAYGDVTSIVTGWEPKVGGFVGEDSSNVNITACHAAGVVTGVSSDYQAGGFIGAYSGGIFTGCSFDSEKNPDLNVAGEGTIASDAVTGEESAVVLSSICEDYFGSHQYSSEWTVDTEATCITDGSKYQPCERCGAKGNITAIPATGHSLIKTEVKDPTCTEDGNIEYWYCENCDKYFSDENAKEEIELENTVLKATGHNWGEPEWSWSEDGKTCTVTFTCENDETHKETPQVSVTSEVKTPATCTETGVTTYTATVEFNGKTYTDTKDVADLAATGHELKKTDAKEATCTEDGNIEYWFCETCGKYFSNENAETEIQLADTVMEATGHSYENGKCTVCGEIDPDFKAVIIEGANGEWQKGTKDGLSFTSNAAFAHFQKVQVDGKDLDASNYTVKEGSTIVTLKAEYLETLSVGKHTLAIVSDTGTATTEFTIKAAAVTDDTQSPQTGDNSNMVLWIALLFVSGGVLSMMFVINKRKIAKNR